VSPFDPKQVANVRAAPPVIQGYILPADGSPRMAFPAPFDVTGDTRYARTQARVGGKAAHDLEFVYNICAWLQFLYNRQLTHEQATSARGRKTSSLDKDTRVALHQLFLLASARYKVLDLATTDGAAAETLRTIVFQDTDAAVYCPAFEFLQTAQTESFVKLAARRHGGRQASGIRGDATAPATANTGRGGRLKGA